MSGVAEFDHVAVSSTVAPVAVIVVSGVGDDTLGGGRDAIVDALAQDPSSRWKTEAECGQVTLVASADTGDTGDDNALRTGLGSPNLREPFPVPTAHVASGNAAPAVDVYEMHWADLSRAQGPVQRLFYLLFAITMQVATLGLEAVRRYDENTPLPSRPARYLKGALTVMSYWLAYIITPLVLAQAALAVVVNLELLAKPSEVISWVLIIVLAPIFAGTGWWIGGRTFSGGWTFDRVDSPWGYAGDADGGGARNLWTLAALAVGLVLSALWLGLTTQTSLPMQLAFLFAVALVTMAIGIHAASQGVLPQEDSNSYRRRGRRAIQGAYAVIPVGALLLAMFNTPRTGGVPARAANALTAIAMGSFRLAWFVTLLLCSAIAGLACWLRFGRCQSDEDEERKTERNDRRRLSATVMLTVMLGPVLYAIATSAMFLVFAAAARIYPDYAKSWPQGLPDCAGPTFIDPIVNCTTTSLSTVDWGSDIVRATVQPLGLAMCIIAVLLGIVAWRFAGYVSSFRARRRNASSVDMSLEQGAAFDSGLTESGRSWLFTIVIVPLVCLTTVAAILFWMTGAGDLEVFGREKLSGIAFPLAYILALLAVAGVGLKNVGFIGKFGGGFLKVLALALDVIYDITTYLRVSNPAIVAPRVRMIARYQAVLAHLRARGYAHVVIMAHSQGSVLSLATLLGDRDRTPRVTPAAAETIPTTITLLTYGCPATQTYARRFPTQFIAWPSGGPSIARWLNVYRAGDYVGRNIVAPDDYDPRNANPPDDTGPANRQERCLGPGHHTGYFTDERWRRVARHVVATPCPASLADVDLGDLTVVNLDGPPSPPSPPPDDPTVALPDPSVSAPEASG